MKDPTPINEFYAGGMLDMTNCKYEQFDEKTTRVTGQVFVPIEGRIKVKLEGARKIGERFIGIAGIRDPYTIKHIDKVIDWARSQVDERFAGKDYQLFYHIYGKNGVMGALEPIKEIKSHELCIVVEGVAPTKEIAEEVTLIGCRQIFYARLPEVKGTAGTAAFVIDGVLPAPPAYTWTMNHVIPVDDPMEFVRFKETIDRIIRRGETMKTIKLVELAKTIRSKNAGTDKITFDIIFREKENYDLVKKSGALTKATIAKLYGIPEERISDFHGIRSGLCDQIHDLSRTIQRQPRGSATSSAASSTRPCWTSKCPWVIAGHEDPAVASPENSGERGELIISNLPNLKSGLFVIQNPPDG